MMMDALALLEDYANRRIRRNVCLGKTQISWPMMMMDEAQMRACSVVERAMGLLKLRPPHCNCNTFTSMLPFEKEKHCFANDKEIVDHYLTHPCMCFSMHDGDMCP